MKRDQLPERLRRLRLRNLERASEMYALSLITIVFYIVIYLTTGVMWWAEWVTLGAFVFWGYVMETAV